MNVHISFIYNSSRWKKKPRCLQWVDGLTENSIPLTWNTLSNKKEPIIDTLSNLDESSNNYAECKKAIPEVAECLIPFL